MPDDSLLAFLTSIQTLAATICSVPEDDVSVAAEHRISDQTGSMALFVDVRVRGEHLTPEQERVLREVLDLADQAAIVVAEAAKPSTGATSPAG